jgi:capsular polysaccharide biosynthesis protein
LQPRAFGEPVSRVEMKITIAVLIGLALAIGIAVFMKYLINR